jgi:hypothetical protein
MDYFDTKNYVKIVKYSVNKNWGSFVWGTIHEVAMGYPENPTETDKDEYKQFYDLIMKVLPCPICKDEYTKIKDLYPIDPTNRDTLFKWTVEIHNVVNEKLGGFTWTVDEARKQWCSTYHELRFKN